MKLFFVGYNEDLVGRCVCDLKGAYHFSQDVIFNESVPGRLPPCILHLPLRFPLPLQVFLTVLLVFAPALLLAMLIMKLSIIGISCASHCLKSSADGGVSTSLPLCAIQAFTSLVACDSLSHPVYIWSLASQSLFFVWSIQFPYDPS
jgi:hypothetical protein